MLPGTVTTRFWLNARPFNSSCPAVAMLSAKRSRINVLVEISPAELDPCGPTRYDATVPNPVRERTRNFVPVFFPDT